LFRALILGNVSKTWSVVKKGLSFIALESFGSPLMYLSVNIPCANGEKQIEPTPEIFNKFNNPSSIQRSNILYFG